MAQGDKNRIRLILEGVWKDGISKPMSTAAEQAKNAWARMGFAIDQQWDEIARQRLKQLKDLEKAATTPTGRAKKGKADELKQIRAEANLIKETLDGWENEIEGSRKAMKRLAKEIHYTGNAAGMVPANSSGRKSLRERDLKRDPAGYRAKQLVFQSARIAQDAPYGLLGIANNIEQFIPAFKEFWSVNATGAQKVRGLITALKGPMGWMFGTALTTAILIKTGALKNLAAAWDLLMAKAFGYDAQQRAYHKEAKKQTAQFLELARGVKTAREEYEMLIGLSRDLTAEGMGLDVEASTDSPVAAFATFDPLGAYSSGSAEKKSQAKRLRESGTLVRDWAIEARKNASKFLAEAIVAAADTSGAVMSKFRKGQIQAEAEFNRKIFDMKKLRYERDFDALREATEREHELEQQRLETEVRVRRELYDATVERQAPNEVVKAQADALQQQLDLHIENKDLIVEKALDELQQEIIEHNRKVRDLMHEAGTSILSSQAQTFARRRQILSRNLEAELSGIRDQIDDIRASEEEKASLTAALQRKQAAARAAYSREVFELEQEERRFLVEQARTVFDEQRRIRDLALQHTMDRASKEEQMRNQLNDRLLELERVRQDEEMKEAHLRNEGLLGLIDEREEAERAAHERSMENLRREYALESERWLLAISREREDLALLRERADLEDRIRGEKSGRFLGLSVFGGNVKDSLGQAQDRIRQGFREREISLQRTFADRIREIEVEMQVESGDRLAELGARRAQLLEMQKIREVELEREKQREMAIVEQEFAVERRRTQLQSAAESLSGFAGIARSQAEMWEQRRRTQLAAEGKTQQQINQIVQAEGKKRFHLYKGLAIVEATISTYLAAQKAAESTAHLGPVIQGAAVAAQIAQGMARVQQIRAQNLGGSGGGAGSAGGGATLGAVATTSSGTGVSPSGRLVNLPRPTEVHSGLLVAGKLDQLTTAVNQLASRPNNVIVGVETASQVVREGNNIIQRRTR